MSDGKLLKTETPKSENIISNKKTQLAKREEILS